MSTGEKTWTVDLTPDDVEWAQEQAQRIADTHEEAVEHVLALARYFSEARDRLKPLGVFLEWVEEETDYSVSAGSQLATIGDLADDFDALKHVLPSSWGTLYELAKKKVKPEVREKVLSQMRQSMTRDEVVDELSRVREQLSPPPEDTDPPGDKDDDGSDPEPPENRPESDPHETLVAKWEDWTGEQAKTGRDLHNRTASAEGITPETWQAVAQAIRTAIDNLRELLDGIIADGDAAA